MDHGNWIKLFRKLKEWGWYTDPHTFRLYMHLLLTVNFEEKEWRGIVVLPGQRICGRKKLAEELDLTEQNIRTSLNNLISTKEITKQIAKGYTLITICKWSEYQYTEKCNQPEDHQRINQRSTNDQPQLKKEKKEKNNSTPEFDLFWDTYDKKVGRDKCLEAWKNIPESEIEIILEHVPRYVASTPDIKFRKNPLTYLTGKHWQDDIICRGITSTTPSNKTPDGRIKLPI